mmetsp:Transcript_58140/g.138352  ORF Transcript_58140/g.138352 Transcript_58140/m.138352 type:complete len:386 (-) Transcript_58140:57-1214(-)
MLDPQSLHADDGALSSKHRTMSADLSLRSNLNDRVLKKEVSAEDLEEEEGDEACGEPHSCSSSYSGTGRLNVEALVAAVTGEEVCYHGGSKELWRSKAFVLARVHECGEQLWRASPELQDNFEVVRMAVSNSGLALRFASERLRGRKEIVTAAVSADGWALRFASEQLQADTDVVAAAVRSKGWAFKFADPLCRADREIALLAASMLHKGMDELGDHDDAWSIAVDLFMPEHPSLPHRTVNDYLACLPKHYLCDETFIVEAIESAPDPIQGWELWNKISDSFLQPVPNAALECIASLLSTRDIILKVAMLSGSTAVVRVKSSVVNIWLPKDICHVCSQYLDINSEATATVVAGGMVVPHDAPVSRWPSVDWGRVNHVQLVISRPD